MKSMINLIMATGMPTEFTGALAWINKIVDFLKQCVIPLCILVASAGAIYAVYVGARFAMAKNTEEREERKKHIISMIVAMIIVVMLISFMFIFKKFVLAGNVDL